MNRLQKLFDTKPSGILNIYFTAGFPNLSDTQTIILELDKAGADLIEIGMPYSDPLADGPVIQQSSERALENGMNLDMLFSQVKNARKTTQTPLILMGYFNQMLQYGVDKFLDFSLRGGGKKPEAAGIDGGERLYGRAKQPGSAQNRAIPAQHDDHVHQACQI